MCLQFVAACCVDEEERKHAVKALCVAICCGVLHSRGTEGTRSTLFAAVCSSVLRKQGTEGTRGTQLVVCCGVLRCDAVYYSVLRKQGTEGTHSKNSKATHEANTHTTHTATRTHTHRKAPPSTTSCTLETLETHSTTLQHTHTKTPASITSCTLRRHGVGVNFVATVAPAPHETSEHRALLSKCSALLRKYGALL